MSSSCLPASAHFPLRQLFPDTATLGQFGGCARRHLKFRTSSTRSRSTASGYLIVANPWLSTTTGPTQLVSLLYFRLVPPLSHVKSLDSKTRVFNAPGVSHEIRLERVFSFRRHGFSNDGPFGAGHARLKWPDYERRFSHGCELQGPYYLVA